jgi:glycosyltransferase involved in cell wall biosynthesis
MITVVIAYFNRQELLNKTLESFLKYDPKEFNVLVVDNASTVPAVLPELPYDIRLHRIEDKTLGHVVITFNTGFKEALKDKPDIIIMQGAECYHQGDILSYAKKVTDDTYISFGCYALGAEETPETVEIINRPCTIDGQRSWYNHPVIRPVGFNFCTVITANNIYNLNGFDERFKDGCGYEDDYFLHQIAMLGLKVEITADPIVYHQFHGVMDNRQNDRWVRNYNLFHTLSKSNTFRAVHTVTPDL